MANARSISIMQITLYRNGYSETTGTYTEEMTLDLSEAKAKAREVETTLANLIAKGWYFRRKGLREMGKVKLMVNL